MSDHELDLPYEQQMRLAELRQQQARWIEEYGFYTHFVFDDPTTPNGVNIHTHGIAEQFGHPDLQIVLPMEMQQANSIFHEMVNQIKEGGSFVPDKEYSGVMKSPYTICVSSAIEGDRPVLRVMLPDVDNKHQDSPVVEFREQWRDHGK